MIEAAAASEKDDSAINVNEMQDTLDKVVLAVEDAEKSDPPH